MSRTFAFLRAINVGGHTVPMTRLKELFEDLGLQGVKTFMASGNVVFEGGPILWANAHLLFWLSLVPFATA